MGDGFIDDTLPGINADLARLEQDLRDVPQIVTDARDALYEAERSHELAKARAYLESSGTVAERNAQVVIATRESAELVDVCKLAFEYARERARSLHDTMGALQTRSANLRKEIDLASRG